MPTFIIDTDQITHAPNASAFTLTEGASIWIFQEGVKVVADNLGGATGINGGGFDGSLVSIEGSVDATAFLLTNFGDMTAIEVTETGRLGQTDASNIQLRGGSDNRLSNDGMIHATQVLLGPDGVVFNNGTIDSTIFGPQDISSPEGADLVSNNGTISGSVIDFRNVVNDGTIGGVGGTFTDSKVTNSDLIMGDVFFFDGDDVYDGSRGGQVTGKVTGRGGDDHLTGGPFVDRLLGEQGNDQLLGLGGDDVLWGGPGNDRVHGGGGDDVLRGNDGSDLMTGGDGADQIEGGPDHDTINGGDGDDTIFGGDGDDVLLGDDDNDRIDGDNGDDRINGGNGDDFLLGDNNNDNILGGAGEDRLFGGPGDDVLVGEAGRDFVRGGSGADLFDFRVGSDVDILLDFADDVDKISLTTFNFADVAQALSFATETAAGDVRFDFDTGDTLVVLNTTIAALQNDIIV